MQRVHPIGRGKENLKLFSFEGFGGFFWGLCYFVGFAFESLLGFGFVGLGFSAHFGDSCVYCLCIQGRLSFLINYYSYIYIYIYIYFTYHQGFMI
jgi:hypothetical protein